MRRVAILCLGDPDVLRVRHIAPDGSWSETVSQAMPSCGYVAEGVEVAYDSDDLDARALWARDAVADVDGQSRLRPREDARWRGETVRPRQAKRMHVEEVRHGLNDAVSDWEELC